MRALWRFFGSIRLAVALILLIIAVSLLGTFLTQIPSQLVENPTLVNEWLDSVARPAFGIWTDILYFAGIFNIYRSPVSLLLTVLLALNIVVCSTRQWRSLARVSRGISFGEGMLLLNSSNTTTQSRQSPGTISTTLSNFLVGRKFRVRQQSANQNTVMIADKYRFSPWSTYLIHLNLIALMTGYAAGILYGFKEDSFIVPENSARDIGHGYGVSLLLKSFEDKYWPDGTPADYFSDVILLKGSEVVKDGRIRVNQPLDYEGLRIYQSFFGPAVTLLVNNGNGNIVYHNNVALSGTVTSDGASRPYGVFLMRDDGIVGYITGRAAIDDKLISADELGLDLYSASDGKFIDSAKLKVGATAALQKLDFTVERQERFSGFQLKSDPGLPLIWIACGLFMIGLLITLFLPHQQMVLMINPQKDRGRTTKILLWTRKSNTSAELDEINQLFGSDNTNKYRDGDL